MCIFSVTAYLSTETISTQKLVSIFELNLTALAKKKVTEFRHQCKNLSLLPHPTFNPLLIYYLTLVTICHKINR